MAADVSIIVPVYNMEHFLTETLDSIEAAIAPSLAVEVIVMDDGSTDGSLAVARDYAARHEHIRVFTQPNAGLAAARNHAIAEARGRYIFPLDSDDLLGRDFLEQAVRILDERPEIKVVCGSDEFFGEKQGHWRLPRFSRSLLARRNLICASALYRRSDWEQAGGYCEYIVCYEDWDFWISMLKGGGEVARLSCPAIHYRIRKGSMRVRGRKQKREVIDTLNSRHAEFFNEVLCGPLHYQRTWSKPLNLLAKWCGKFGFARRQLR